MYIGKILGWLFMSKFLNILLNKGIKAPPLSWRTSYVGSKINSLCNSVKELFKPNKLGQQFSKVMWSNPNEKSVQAICDVFEKETGLKLLMTSPKDAYCFNEFGNVLLRDIKEGRYPKDLKYVVFGHGEGSSLINSGKDKWHVLADSNIGIFDFINKNIPKGEKVLVNCCETTPKQYKHLLPKEKPAIGYPTNTDASSTYYYPLKIVQSGRNEIIGGYANGIMTLY